MKFKKHYSQRQVLDKCNNIKLSFIYLNSNNLVFYYNYILIQMMKQIKNQGQQTYETSDSQSHHCQTIPSIFKYYSDANTSLFNKCFSFQRFQYSNQRNQSTKQFFQRKSQNIVIKSNNGLEMFQKKRTLNTKEKKTAEIKKMIRKMPAQKESRNVLSNILRIFLKCMLQNKIYDVLIQKIAQKYNLIVNKQQFYKWVLNFNINFKNYIQQSQIKRLFATNSSLEYKKIMMIVVRHYLNNYAVSYCLTSKKIERGSVRMHLLGLKELQKKIIEFSK